MTAVVAAAYGDDDEDDGDDDDDVSPSSSCFTRFNNVNRKVDDIFSISRELTTVTAAFILLAGTV